MKRKEVETQILPGNLLDAVTTRSQNNVLLQHSASTSPPSLFQKFRLQREDDTYISNSIERKRKLAFNHHQHQFTATGQPATSLHNLQIKICTRCRTSNSPEWRRGPDGHKTYVILSQLSYYMYT